MYALRFKSVVGDLFANLPTKTNGTYQHEDGIDDAPDMPPVIIAHICNDIGKFGSGFVVPLAQHFPVAREEYLKWYAEEVPGVILPDANLFQLGNVQHIQVDENLWVANMIGQHKTGFGPDGRPPIRYAALADCLRTVGKFAKSIGAEIHAPQFGAGLAGGNWDIISTLIDECWCDMDIPVTIYSLE